jgi:hypothetical protein
MNGMDLLAVQNTVAFRITNYSTRKERVKSEIIIIREEEGFAFSY